MSRTHDVTISAFTLDRLEAELAAWKSVAQQLHFALQDARPGQFHGSFDAAIRAAALDSYVRLKATLPYEL